MLAEGGFGFVYMLHFAARTKDPGRYQEYKLNIEKYNDWFDPKTMVESVSALTGKRPKGRR